jgi:hypothetical protein
MVATALLGERQVPLVGCPKELLPTIPSPKTVVSRLASLKPWIPALFTSKTCGWYTNHSMAIYRERSNTSEFRETSLTKNITNRRMDMDGY